MSTRSTPDGTITSWNYAATRIFGHLPVEAVGRPITMVFPPERPDEEPELMARIARGDRIEHLETRRIHKDGSTIDVSITLSALRDPHGRIGEISRIVRDITARKRLDAEALAAELETVRAFFESAAEGIVIVNQAGRIVPINVRGEQMFGYAQGDLVGLRLEILLSEGFRAAHRGHRVGYFAAPRTRAMGLGVNLVGQRKNGGEFPVEISLTSIQTPDGLLTMALVTDISERRALEPTARQHEKLAALATLSAGIAEAGPLPQRRGAGPFRGSQDNYTRQAPGSHLAKSSRASSGSSVPSVSTSPARDPER